MSAVELGKMGVSRGWGLGLEHVVICPVLGKLLLRPRHKGRPRPVLVFFPNGGDALYSVR